MADRFRRVFRYLVPAWLGGQREHLEGSQDEGFKHLYSLGVVMDAFIQRAHLGVRARFPQTPGGGESIALDAIGRDRKLRRGRNEAAAAYARRLVQWRYPGGHRTRGNPFALLRQIRAYLGGPIKVRTVDVRGNWYTIAEDGTETYAWNTGTWAWDWTPGVLPGTPAGAEWSRFWVIVYSTGAAAPWALQTYGGAGLEFGQSGLYYGGITPADVSTLRAIVREWKPAGTTCDRILVATGDPDPFDPIAPEPDGTWGNPRNRRPDVLYLKPN